MATEKILNTRIGLKVDTLENWSKSTLPLKKGEVAFATVAATAGTGLAEPVVMMKIGEDGVKTFKDIEWNFYAKASDVLAACKSEDALKTFVNGVIADAGIASNDAMEALAGRVTTTENDIKTLKGDENTAGSVAKAIKDAIDALDLANTYVAIEDGKSLMTDAEHTKLAGISEGANKVENVGGGKIKIDGTEVTVYAHPEKHAISDVTGLQDALDGKSDNGHKHVAEDITDLDNTIKGYDYATKTEAQGYANEKDAAIKAAKDAADAAQGDVDNLEKYVGTFTASEGVDTVVKYIDAKTANIASDERVNGIEGRVKAIEDDCLVGEDKTELSNLITAEKERAEAAEAKALEDAKAYTDEVKKGILGEGITETYDTLKEIENWIKGDGVDATELTSAIAGEAALREEADTALSGRLDALEAIDHTHKNFDLLETYTQTEADLADAVVNKHSHTFKDADVVDAISVKHSHSFADETALNGITSAKVQAWDAAEQNAKDYADDQIEALDLGTMSKEPAADYVKKADAPGFGDILTKTDAQGLYQAKGEYYTKTEADAEFTNATEVDGQIDAKITALDLANTYQAKGEYATAEQGGKADTAIQSVTSVAGNGIKATTSGTAVTIDWDSEVTFVFDCGDSGVNA